MWTEQNENLAYYSHSVNVTKQSIMHAQGHKCHGWDSNPHSVANTRT